MKTHSAAAIVLCIIMAGIVLGSFREFALSETAHGFTFKLEGKALDRLHYSEAPVALSLRGTENERWTGVIHMRLEGGDLDVNGYDTFSVSRGDGILVYRYHFVFLTIKMAGPYGGDPVSWYLRGTTGTLIGKSLPVSLYANNVVLPTLREPKLYGLWLKGTITLD